MNNELIKEIEKLKTEKNAVILAHYYAPDEAQAVADHVGDSFYLARVAKNTQADVIVFCGVAFMGESAKILNPDKRVLMPDMSSDCAMAHMAEREKIAQMRALYPDLQVACYINSTAELKCMSDVCVTSSNALKIVERLESQNVYFIPDQHLARYVAARLPQKNIIPGEGYCPVHTAITAESVLEQKRLHPAAPVLTHPECKEEVVALSDMVGSTAEIISFVKESDAEEFIICTEVGVTYQLRLDNPDKRFYFGGEKPKCMDMKLNTLDNIVRVLKSGENEVVLDEAIRQRALLPLERMLEMAK